MEQALLAHAFAAVESGSSSRIDTVTAAGRLDATTCALGLVDVTTMGTPQ